MNEVRKKKTVMKYNCVTFSAKSEIHPHKQESNTQDTECTLFPSPSESNDTELSEKHIDSRCISSSNEESCYEIERNAFLKTEMQMNTGSSNCVLHYADLNSPSNVSSAEMPKDSGRWTCSVTLFT